MDDFNKTTKYDLRQTRFSQNFEHSIQYIEKQDFDNHQYHNKNNYSISYPSKNKNSYRQNFLIQEDQSVMYNKQTTSQQQKHVKDQKEQKQNTKYGFVNFTKSFSYLEDQLTLSQSHSNINNDNNCKIQCTQSMKQDQQKNCQSSDSDDVFSEKISLIRQLQKKLQSLHQKIKIPSIPTNNYFNDYKLNIEKEYEIYSLSTLQNQKQYSVTNDTNQKSELSQISQAFSERKSIAKYCNNQSMESQSMLLDKDYQIYQKQIPTKKIIGKSHPQHSQVQFVEMIRVVEVPYLIEVNRDIDEKIQSKKSFYFEQNQQLHQTFQQFTQKQSLHEHMLNMQTKIKPETINQECQMNEFQLQYSGTNVFKIQSNCQNSIISINQSNKTFHNVLKDKRNDISYNCDENSGILSKILTKHNNGEVQELQEKLKTLQIQNSQLKQKIKQFATQKFLLEQQNQALEVDLQNLFESEQIYHQKLNKYKQKLQNIQQQFAQILYLQQTELKDQYEKQIQQYQNQQSEYANRIIAFEQMFQDHKEKQKNVVEFIQKQSQQIQYLNRLCKQKQYETQIEMSKRRQAEQMVIYRQKELKLIIQNLQKDNVQLKNIINQIHTRYQSQGFYILKQQAQQLKHTIQEKDLIHIQELDKLENRYSALIQKYQNQLETMKKGLEKVRFNKSISMSNNIINTSNPLYNRYPNKNQLFIKKRQSIPPSKISNSILCSSFGQSSSQLNKFSQLKMRHVESLQHSQIDEPLLQQSINASKFSHKNPLQNESYLANHSQSENENQRMSELILLEMETLRQQNSKLKVTLTNEKQEKQSLSQKLLQISQVMNKYMNHINESQSESQKNEQVFLKCVQQLQKQYVLNKRLKQKLARVQLLNRSDSIRLSDNSMSMNSEQIKQKIQQVKKVYKNIGKAVTGFNIFSGVQCIVKSEMLQKQANFNRLTKEFSNKQQ